MFLPARALLLVLAAATSIVACGAGSGASTQTPSNADDASTSSGDAAVEVVADSEAPMRVLFVGNSYTYVNDLPGTVRAIGAASGSALDVDSVTVGGATLGDHWESTGARARIAAGGWDVVVLQGQSVEPLEQPDVFDHYAGLLAGAARDVGARTVWYATWARRADDPYYAFIDGPGTPAFMARQLDVAYRSAGADFGGSVARAGEAWQIETTRAPSVNLYAADGSHPSAEGTLLTACVMAQAITGKAPRLPDPPPLGVARETAESLCAIAPEVACGKAPCGCLSSELVHTSFGALGAFEPACDASAAFGPACKSAIHSFCSKRACDQSGFGPVTLASDGSDGVDVACLAGDVRTTTFGALAAFDPSCDGVIARDGPHCNWAIDRWCTSVGALSGFGPVSIAGGDVTVTCLSKDGGDVLITTYGYLSRLQPKCDGIVEQWGPSCDEAIHVRCRYRGHVSGFGPTAISDSLGGGPSAYVVCVDG